MSGRPPAIILRDTQVRAVDVLTEEEQAKAAEAAAYFVKEIPYCPVTPNEGPQTSFLLDFGRESLYGGAAGGGKSWAILMAASQFLHVPDYSALLLRKTFADLNRPGALMDIADDWWGGKDGVRYDRQDHAYIFTTPSGGKSKIVFGSMDDENARHKYQGGAYHFVGYDEVTHFKERDYRYLFSRMRRVTEGPLSRIPIRMRATANPGGVGHAWVYNRFISPWEAWHKGKRERPRRNFWPAMLSDNPKLDQEDYIRSLDELDPVTRAQLLRGDWNIRPDGRMFKRRWFKLVKPEDVPGNCSWVRYWDMASTEEMPVSGILKDPDYTAGALVGRSPDGRYFVWHIGHWRHEPAENDLMIGATAVLDARAGRGRVHHVMEQEPGSSGKTDVHHRRTQVFDGTGVSFRGIPSTGSKVLRAGPVASMADAGNIYVVNDGTWDVEDFLSEIEIFPDGEHDDYVDSLSGAMEVLGRMHKGEITFDGANADFFAHNQWRPDSNKSFTLQDVMTGWVKGVLDKQGAEHFTPDMIAGEMARAWAV